MANVKADFEQLKGIMRCLKDSYTLRVGIIGSKAKIEHGKGESLTNAELGTIHEFGTKTIPKRSFLEMPLKEKLNFSKDEMKPFKKVLFQQFFNKKAPQKFFIQLGAKALQAIEEAFATNGFGMWAALSPLTVERRASKIKSKKRQEEFRHMHNILTDTGKLRHSIDFKVIKNG